MRRARHSMPLCSAVGLTIAAIAVIIAIMAGIDEAQPHEAEPTAAQPQGWSYPFSCCSGYDCRAVPADWVKESSSGFRIVITGEIVGYSDTRLKDSPDGDTHWCSVAGANDGRTICLFVPPRSF